MKRLCLYVLVLISALLGSCDSFEFSPNQVFDDNSEINLNSKNLIRLDTLPHDDTITFAFVGDSQRFYDQLDLFVDTVNHIPEIDFVILAGDVSDFGLLTEFELINNFLAKLEKPYFGVIGNHDAVQKGHEVFERMYGPLDFSFDYGGVRFVCHNTNSKEFDSKVPDIAWLRTQLVKNDSVKYFIPVSHVPPYSTDFDEALVGPYTSLFSETPGLLASMHAHVHIHQDTIPYNDGIRYITSDSFDKRSFLMMTVVNGQIFKTIIDY